MPNVLNHFAASFPFFLVLMGLLAAALFPGRLLLRKGRRPALGRVTLLWLLASWLQGVLLVTVLLSVLGTVLAAGAPGPPVPPRVERLDLVPLRTFFQDGPGLGGIAAWERLGNILMFLVGGFLTALALNWKVARTAAAFLLLGVVIEALQYWVPDHRAVTTDDVLWAAFGGTFGALLALPLQERQWYSNLVNQRRPEGARSPVADDAAASWALQRRRGSRRRTDPDQPPPAAPHPRSSARRISATPLQGT